MAIAISLLYLAAAAASASPLRANPSMPIPGNAAPAHKIRQITYHTYSHQITTDTCVYISNDEQIFDDEQIFVSSFLYVGVSPLRANPNMLMPDSMAPADKVLRILDY
jgi:hypothetical protein